MREDRGHMEYSPQDCTEGPSHNSTHSNGKDGQLQQIINQSRDFLLLSSSLPHRVVAEEPRPQGDHGEVHGEGAGEEGTGGDEHATPTHHEQQHPLGNRGTKLLQDGPEGEGHS